MVAKAATSGVAQLLLWGGWSQAKLHLKTIGILLYFERTMTCREAGAGVARETASGQACSERARRR